MNHRDTEGHRECFLCVLCVSVVKSVSRTSEAWACSVVEEHDAIRRRLLRCIRQHVRASAHDFWIEPSTFHPAVGRSRDRLVARRPEARRRAAAEDPAADRSIRRSKLAGSGRSSDARAPIRRASPSSREGGLHWIGYQSNPYPVALEGPKFEDYLRDEGLERIIDARKKKGQSAAPGGSGSIAARRRCCETPGVRRFDTPLGFTLELRAAEESVRDASGR